MVYGSHMAVELKLIGEAGALEYEDDEHRVFRYEVAASGTLAIYQKPPGGFIEMDAAPSVVYGPAAWFSVSGDVKSRGDDVPVEVRFA